MAIFLILCLSTGSTHCQVVTHPPTEVFNLKIDPQNLFQEIDHFGASDAWSGQFVGNWPEDKKQTITDLLFSKDMDEQGNPIGIGLSLWRMNLGAASAGQGDGSGIRDPWRRAPSFLNEDGHFDREGQKGQFWLAHTAKEKKVEYLLAFLNSPPVWLTRNGKAFVDSGKQSNLASENQAAFANFMVATLMGLKEEGLAVDYISPVNEPQWDWEDGGQEGTPFWNREIASIVRSLDAKLQESGLSTKIDIAEAGQIEYLYGEHNRPGRANQIREFFEKDSENYIGDLAHLSTAISGHSYFTTSPVHQAVRKRELVANAVQQVPRLKYWMSEYCILGGNEGEISGSGKDLGMTPALYMARVIYHDLVVAQASAWHWWLAISPYDYKDGLVYISKSETDGDMEESKMLWAMGNYSRFIRPGYRRVSATLTDQQMQNKDLLASAYRDPESGNLVIVLVNANNSEAKVSLQVERDGIPEEWAGYLTDKDHDLAFRSILSPEEVLVPASSILTLTTGVP
ncbi:glycoside hydrolase [Cyclobacterium jeungdonense]|uniref:Glycoside hydrolase n=1 Tax=Cyclobacterium jeungdonense TaxID=708087 RepID=A0ABT8CEU2_9BACT|nr:glycoside hydrolase [Cyclobacterium jeungdonense]MDN3690712.1 glycoside hydrolase [Cyclobacterium jeungdonense]